MVLLLAFIVLTMNLSNVYAIDDLSTLFPTVLRATVSGTSDTLSVSNTNAMYSGYCSGTFNGGHLEFDFTRTRSSGTDSIFQIPTDSNFVVESMSGLTQDGYNFNASAKGVSSGHLSITFDGSAMLFFYSGSDGYSMGGTSTCTYTFTELQLGGVSYVGGVPPAKSPYSIENGWLTVIDLGSNGASYDINLSTQFNVNSGLISQNWSETSQTYWFSNSLPSVGSSYENTGTLIQWERGNPRNIFGQTKYGIYDLIGASTGRYLYILNPFYRSIADSEHPTIVNYPITINGLFEGQQAYIYEVTASATVTGVVNAISTTTIDGVTSFSNWGTTSGGAVSVDLTNSFINTDNDTTTIQTQGGGNANETAQTINSYLQQIQNVLDSFVEQVLGLLSAPISHIQQLIQSGENFFSVFSHLFDWLPSDVSGVISSALIVMVVIGVLKMLL